MPNLPDLAPGIHDYEELSKGYDPNDAYGFTRTLDYRTYIDYLQKGGDLPGDLSVLSAHFTWDVGVLDGLRSFLLDEGNNQAKYKLVKVMGGHALQRGTAAYRAVVMISKELTQKEFLVVTGGGPGAMEAAHVGACFAYAKDDVLEEVLSILAAPDGASLPDNCNVIDKDSGAIADDRKHDASLIQKWYAAGMAALGKLGNAEKGKSLAVPTWFYGNEPTTAFASHYAKFFNNDLREAILTGKYPCGVIYSRGGGGTIREMFEQMEVNFYASDPASVTPMIFCDSDDFWAIDATFKGDGSVEKPGVNVKGIIDSIIRFSHASHMVNGVMKPSTSEEALKKMLWTTDVNVMEGVLNKHAPISSRRLAEHLSLGPAHFVRAALSRWPA